MMKNPFILLALALLLVQCKSAENAPVHETKQSSKNQVSQPKLVVGIVVDQMRYDYLTRFWGKYGEDGFKRLVSEGYNFKNNHYNYVPTFTAPGHASIYTGTTPKNHGIISNYWYDKSEGKRIYCVADKSVSPIGTSSSEGKRSPHRMLTTTLSDQNRLHTQMRGKTIGIALKDRSAILPAGHTASAAYWFHGADEGKFISSSYYMDKLPQWVQNFNASGAAEKYLKVWDTYLPIETYTETGPDLNDFEKGFTGKQTATFPYDLKKLMDENGGFTMLNSTPYGNDLTTDFAIAALDGEALGQDGETDFLTVSYSSTDYVGHNFGVNSKEIEDTYIRLDMSLAKLLQALDKKVGKGNYTLFLTADHGAGHVPNYLKSRQIPAGYFHKDSLEQALKNFLGREYGLTGLVDNISNNQLFFDYKELKSNNIPSKSLQVKVKHFLLGYPGIDKVFTRNMLNYADYTEGMGWFVQNGFHQKRSGDLVYVFEPGFIEFYHSEKGTTHGSGYNYDTHVSLIFYGWGIKNGETAKYSEITDIAPTVSALLGLAFPNGATGKVLYEVFE
jgi:predicted AlkP superfamily pyrophosphatase or phosphodiesterase